jgi:hypothetical protein
MMAAVKPACLLCSHTPMLVVIFMSWPITQDQSKLRNAERVRSALSVALLPPEWAV